MNCFPEMKSGGEESPPHVLKYLSVCFERNEELYSSIRVLNRLRLHLTLY